MNITELKSEAQRLGLSVAKKITYEQVSQCPCGNKHIASEISYRRGKYYRCSKCGYEGEVAKYKYQAIINWNNATRDTDRYKKHYAERMIKLFGKYDSDTSFWIRVYTDYYKDGTFSLGHLKEKLCQLESAESEWANHRNCKSYLASVEALKSVIWRIENGNI